MKKIILFLLVVSFNAEIASSQAFTPAQDTLIKKEIKKEVTAQNEELLNFLKLLGVAVGGLTIFGLFTWFHKIKKTADEQIALKSGEIIEKKLAEKIGVKYESLKEIVEKYEKEKSVKQSRILIVNKNGDRKQTIVAALKSGGFVDDTKITAQSVAAFPQSIINANNQDVVIFDNEAGDFKEHEIIPFVQQLKGQTVKMVCYTTDDWAAFKTYSGADYNLKFAKLPNLIADRIKQSFGL
jgi:hypothetical protein